MERESDQSAASQGRFHIQIEERTGASKTSQSRAAENVETGHLRLRNRRQECQIREKDTRILEQ